MIDNEGMVHVPIDRPGIGAAVDRDFIDTLTVRTEVLVAGRRLTAVV
ncbi:MAG: hypothetical protein ABI580_13170 [Burkholderiaceae bacterium]